MPNYKFDCGCKFKVIGSHPHHASLPLLDFRIQEIPEDCEVTWNLIHQGLLTGCFQIESYLGKRWCQEIAPNNIDELAAVISLIRPGCLKALIDGKSMTVRYRDRKRGEEDVSYLDPALEPILDETYGVIVFQENSIRIATECAGFDLSEADKLRKAAGKKDAALMAQTRKLFLEKAVPYGVLSQDTAVEIFDLIEKSNRYSFNKSHAVSYAKLAYWSAYIKVHFNVYYLAAWLNFSKNKQETYEDIANLVDDARFFDVQINTPSLNNCSPHFFTDGKVVTFGLSDIKNMGQAGSRQVLEGVKHLEEKTYKKVSKCNWMDVIVYMTEKVSPSNMELIINTGFFDSLGLTRSQLLYEHGIWTQLTNKERNWVRQHYQYDNMLDSLQGLAKLKSEGGGCANKNRIAIVAGLIQTLKNPTSDLTDTPRTVIKKEQDLLGVPITYSLVDTVDVPHFQHNCRDVINHLPVGTQTSVHGELLNVYFRTTKKGNSMATFSLRDGTGRLDNCVIFPREYDQFNSHLMSEEAVLLCKGEIGKNYQLIVKEIVEL